MERKDQDFLEYVVKSIVEFPDKVQIERRVDEMGVLLELKVDLADMGKLIGKEGRTAKAIRTLLRVIGAQTNARINLKIVEPEGSTHSAGGSSYANESSVEAPANEPSISESVSSDLDDLAS